MKSVVAAGLLLVLASGGPYDIILLRTQAVPDATGAARLVFAESPFGVAVTRDGVAEYDVVLDLAGLPAPATLGSYSAYVAWAAMPDLSRWYRLGVVGNGASRVGRVALNKFLLVVTAEADSTPTTRKGPTIFHGLSPSSWLQSFLSHPLFRGIPPG